MIAVSGLCAIAVSFVHFSMRDTLESNARLARNRTIASAFGLTVGQQSAEAYDEVLRRNVTADTIPDQSGRWEIFTGKKPPHDIGFIFSGMGFWDMIHGILVLSPDLSAIRSFEVIEQKETPGLGARIEEETFKRQFAGYPLNWTDENAGIVTFGEAAGGVDGRRIDAITGATQTSMALERILNSELAAFRKAYDRHANAGSAEEGGN
jgi:Na+-transporting NADH:ubiquinone oxidoreductase subunit C